MHETLKSKHKYYTIDSNYPTSSGYCRLNSDFRFRINIFLKLLTRYIIKILFAIFRLYSITAKSQIRVAFICIIKLLINAYWFKSSLSYGDPIMGKEIFINVNLRHGRATRSIQRHETNFVLSNSYKLRHKKKADVVTEGERKCEKSQKY